MDQISLISNESYFSRGWTDYSKNGKKQILEQWSIAASEIDIELGDWSAEWLCQHVDKVYYTASR
jgi:hypothetical protein